LSIGLDIVGADVEVLVGEVVADLLTIDEEDPDPVQTDGSGVVAAITSQNVTQ
jgi:hypothetical protein